MPKVIKIRYIGSDAADADLGSGMWFEYSGSAPTNAQMVTFATAVGAAWATDLAPIVDTGFTLTKVEAVDLSSPSSAQGIATVSHAGARAGTPLPLNVCFTLQEITPLRRRGGHWHVQQRCGVQADLANPQNWTSAFITSAINALGGFVGGIQAAVWSGGGTMSQVGIQYYGPPNRTITSSTGRVRTVSTLLTVPVIWPITSFNANSRLGSQRRRLGKSGG